MASEGNDMACLHRPGKSYPSPTVRQAQDSIATRVADFRRVLADVHGPTERARLVGHLLSSRAGRALGRNNSDSAINVQFRSFSAEFGLSQGEIAPYTQMLRDIDAGVIPTGSEVNRWNVIDAGANVGLFSLFMRQARQIIAIEPNPRVN